MARRPPERYNPGELEKTRRNLGNIPDSEARVIARKLGGEIGVERMPDEIRKEYQRLQSVNRRKSDQLLHTPAPLARNDSSFGTHSPLEPSLQKIKRSGPGYLEQVRINFLLADPDYGIKTRANAWLSLVRFAIPVKDTVSSDFLIKADSIFYSSLEKMVLAVRGLLNLNSSLGIRKVRHPGYNEILQEIRSWDLELISRELSRLQRSPRGVPVTEMKRLLKALYRPIIILGNLDIHNHILKAIKHITDLSLLALPKNSPDNGRLKRLYSTARQEAIIVFTDVKKTLYPLLLRLSDSHYLDCNDFFIYAMPNIMFFLALTENNILLPFDDDNYEPDPAEKEKTDEDQDESFEEELPETVNGEQVLPIGVEKGLLFLDTLFPEAGFADLSAHPDLFSYFSSILSFPGGLDLIHPQNPVHPLMVLAAIIQELFYGFRGIEFGSIERDKGQAESIQPQIDRIINNWHRFLDEVLHQHYIHALRDYCRQIEQIPGRRYDNYGSKLETILQFFIRKYILPHLPVASLRGVKAPFPEKLYKIHETANEIKTLLEEILNLDLTNAVPMAVRNSTASLNFEIENHVSRRLKKYLEKKDQPANNRNLLKYTLLCVTVLDYLVQHPDSCLYRDTDFIHYRHEEGRADIPVYTAVQRDTESILMHADIELTPPHELGQPGPEKEEATRIIIKKHIDTLVANDCPLSVLAIGFPAAMETQMEPIVRIIENEIREYMDILIPENKQEFLLVLPETGEENALSLFLRLKDRFRSEQVIQGCIIPCMKSWGPTKLLKTARQGLNAVGEQEAGVLFSYNPMEHSFEPHPWMKTQQEKLTNQ